MHVRTFPPPFCASWFGSCDFRMHVLSLLPVFQGRPDGHCGLGRRVRRAGARHVPHVPQQLPRVRRHARRGALPRVAGGAEARP